MMAIVQKKMNIERSIYEMLQIVSLSLADTTTLKTSLQNLTKILSMNWMFLPNQVCLIVKLYNRPELLPDSNEAILEK